MIVDTNFLVDLARGDPGARALIETVARGSDALRVPAPALARFWEGVERARTPPRDTERVRAILEAASVVAFGASHAFRAGRLAGAAARGGEPMDPFDAMVAAVAIVEDEPLVSRNARVFGAVPGLRTHPY